MKKLVCLSVAAFVAVCLLTAPQRAEARPPYLAGFTKAFGEVEAVKKAAEEMKCGVCHGKDKKQRSDFAKAFGKALGAPNVKEAEKISEALAKVAKEKVKADGTETYGDLLKAGKLPEPFKAP